MAIEIIISNMCVVFLHEHTSLLQNMNILGYLLVTFFYYLVFLFLAEGKWQQMETS